MLIRRVPLGNETQLCATEKYLRLASLRRIAKRIESNFSKGTRNDATKRIRVSRGDDDLSHRAFERAFARLRVGVLLRELRARKVLTVVVVGCGVRVAIARKRIR